MDVEFEFKEKNGGACVTKLLAPGAVCVVPESLGGLPVTELADKVFSGSTVEKVYLPRTLTRIGRYEFYGCEKLQEIHFYGALREVGGGVFTGCRNIRSLTVHMGVDEESALRDFVTEINERVTVHVFIQDGQNRMQDERDTDSARTSLASSTTTRRWKIRPPGSRYPISTVQGRSIATVLRDENSDLTGMIKCLCMKKQRNRFSWHRRSR